MADKNALLERLNRRDAQRVEKIHKSQKAKEQTDAVGESVFYFEEAFKEKTVSIEAGLAKIPTIERSELPNLFNEIKKEIADLNKYLISSSLFLKEFNMRKFLGIVQHLQTKCYDLEEQFAPRKKFGFSRKKMQKTDLNPVLPRIKDVVDGESLVTWDENFFGFQSKESEVLVLEQEDLYQRDVQLRNLKSCTVLLKGIQATLHMTNIDNCVILSGPITTSVFVEKCTNSKIVVACQQLRMHSSKNCDVYLHVTCKGIIEDCSNINVAPYNLDYEGLEKHMQASTLNKNINNWNKLDDFNWLAVDVPSPNWFLLEESKRVKDWTDWMKRIPI